MGERRVRNAEVEGSIPFHSTKYPAQSSPTASTRAPFPLPVAFGEVHVQSGKVTVSNAGSGRFVVKDAAGKFTAFALDAPAKVKRGELVYWEPMPGQTRMVVRNATTNASLQVNALALGVSRAHAEAFLKGIG